MAVALLAIPFEADFKDICGNRWLDRAAQIKAESNFNPGARSPDGGEGLGQATKIWPEYVRRGWVPADSTPFQPRPAIMGAHHYMNHLEPRAGGWIPGCGAYNAGLGSILKAKQLADLAGDPREDGWLYALPQVTKAKSRFTINYIHTIRAVRAQYRKTYGV